MSNKEEKILFISISKSLEQEIYIYYIFIFYTDTFYIHNLPKLLKIYDNKKGIKWNWQSLDSISVKSPLGGR